MSVRLLILTFLCWYGLSARAQDSCFLVTSGHIPSKTVRLDKGVMVFADTLARKTALQDILNTLHADGYLLAAWEVSQMRGDTMFAQIVPGDPVKWATLKVRESDRPFLEAAGYRTEDFTDEIYDHARVSGLMVKLIEKLANKGYPFAEVRLDSIVFEDSVLNAVLVLHKHTFIQFDSVKVVGNLDVQDNFIQQYTGIIAGEPYDQSLINALPARLRQIVFATITKNPVIEFSGNRATVILYAEAKRTSRFDFVLGVLPNNAITGRLIITGDLQLQLQNIFNAGEQLFFQYNKLESSSKSLDATFAYPYLPKLPIGPDAGFYLYLKDSTFLERKANAGLVYQISGNNTLKAFTAFFNSSVLRPDTSFALNNFALPAMLDVRDRSYGISWKLQHLDFLFNPRKGYAWMLTGTVGTRTILENASIIGLSSPEFPDYDFASLYDSIDTRSLSSRYMYDVQWYVPVLKNATILFQARGASMLYDQIVQNELFRIGGNALLRGFDEQSIAVSDYHIGTVEFRYLLGQRSYAALFADGGYTANRTLLNPQKDYPYGFGAGVRFETKAGIFGLTYALGGRREAPVEFRNTKVHFGYVNFF